MDKIVNKSKETVLRTREDGKMFEYFQLDF
jgi:hypothetical protein